MAVRQVYLNFIGKLRLINASSSQLCFSQVLFFLKGPNDLLGWSWESGFVFWTLILWQGGGQQCQPNLVDICSFWAWLLGNGRRKKYCIHRYQTVETEEWEVTAVLAVWQVSFRILRKQGFWSRKWADQDCDNLSVRTSSILYGKINMVGIIEQFKATMSLRVLNACFFSRNLQYFTK